MTQKERDQCKNLVEEAKQKEVHDTSGEYKYRVRGPPGKMIIKNTAQAVKSNKDVPDAVKCNRNLNVVHTNADGLLNKRQDLNFLIKSFQKPPDTIAITEFKPKRHKHQ